MTFPTPKTILDAINDYLDSVKLSRSENTALTYRHALNYFIRVLEVHNLDPIKSPISDLREDTIIWFATALKDFSSSTERLYLTTASGFFEYLAAENLSEINLARIHLLIHQRARRPGQRLPQFPESLIEMIITSMINLTISPAGNNNQDLIDARDRAFLITLADTGLRVHEACKLHRGDIDWNEGHALIIGKGNRQDMVRFSQRSIKALREYLSLRAYLDGSSNRPLPSLPLFARHDKGAGKKIKPITTTTGRNIVSARVEEILGRDAVGSITPHSFRHYFVTKVLKGSGNLKLAQELARHRNIAVTQRYAHLSDDELDRGYWNVFDEGKKSEE